ncbi:MAG: hypothetical protein F4Z77_02905 [Dehalococcoidia bacterium]|nr:hypothetical protein [Dehalococcoidia bacterium]MYA54524.1 hypothetical protein [Dehalococcoidia bacterium]
MYHCERLLVAGGGGCGYGVGGVSRGWHPALMGLVRWPRGAGVTGALVVAALVLGVAWSLATAAAQESGEGRYRIEGVVVDGSGNPVEGLWISAYGHGQTPGEYAGQWTGTDGMFRLQLEAGGYRMAMHSDGYGQCTVSGLKNPDDQWQAVFELDREDLEGLRVVVTSSAPVEGSAWTFCHVDAPTFQVQGAVLGPSDEPLEGVRVRAVGMWGRSDPDLPGSVTTANGVYELEVPNGSFLLELSRVIGGLTCGLGYVDANGDRWLRRPASRGIAVDGAGVRGLDVKLPGRPSDLCKRIQGVASGSDGGPLTGARVEALGRGALANWSLAQVVADDGSFTLYGLGGIYGLRVTTTAGSVCKVTDVGSSRSRAVAGVVVGSAGATGIRLVVSGEPRPSQQRLMCQLPPEMVTTQLKPGWNLAAWTGAEAKVEVIFETIPQLQLVYAWDATEQRFLRGAPAGSTDLGGLTTLSPGMGLWLQVGGTEPVSWTRDLLAESGLLSLQEGWNLVGWVGHDGAEAEDSFASLGQEFDAAAAWVEGADRFLIYHPDAPSPANRLLRLNRGGAFWLHLSTARRWLQPGTITPWIETASEVPEETRLALPPLVNSVVAYFSERSGYLVDDVTFYMGSWPGVGGVYIHPGRAVVVTRPEAIAHEYAHALQWQLGVDGDPPWITEGVANRWSAQYYEATGDRMHETHLREVTRPGARMTYGVLDHRSLPTGSAGSNQSLFHLAANWLATLAGDQDAWFRYFGKRSSFGSWQDAFEGAFGISVDNFYKSFEAHRSEVAPPLARIRGTVLDPHGQPVPGVHVRAHSQEKQPGAGADTHRDGTFTLPLGDGAFQLAIHADTPGGRHHIGWFGGAGGFTPLRSQAQVIEVGGEDITGVTIQLEELRWYWIEGVVVGPSGQPVEGVNIDAYPTGDYEGPYDITGADGSFRIPVLGGSFELHLYFDAPDGRRRAGSYSSDIGFSPLFEADEVEVRDEDITEITIRLPADPSTGPWYRIEGVVLGPDGEPLEGMLIDAYPIGEHPGPSDVTDANGSFSMLVLGGTFELHLYADTPDGRIRLGYYHEDEGFTTHRHQAGGVEVPDGDVAGITISIPAEVITSWLR